MNRPLRGVVFRGVCCGAPYFCFLCLRDQIADPLQKTADAENSRGIPRPALRILAHKTKMHSHGVGPEFLD